jgi:hypothetical protein
MSLTAKWHKRNKFGEIVIAVPFTQRTDAQYFAKFIAKNVTRFSLIGCRQAGEKWEVVYRPRSQYPWQERRCFA